MHFEQYYSDGTKVKCTKNIWRGEISTVFFLNAGKVWTHSWISALHRAKNTLLDIRLSGFSRFYKFVHVCKCNIFLLSGSRSKQNGIKEEDKVETASLVTMWKLQGGSACYFLDFKRPWLRFDACLRSVPCSARNPALHTPYRTASFLAESVQAVHAKGWDMCCRYWYRWCHDFMSLTAFTWTSVQLRAFFRVWSCTQRNLGFLLSSTHDKY